MMKMVDYDKNNFINIILILREIVYCTDSEYDHKNSRFWQRIAIGGHFYVIIRIRQSR